MELKFYVGHFKNGMTAVMLTLLLAWLSLDSTVAMDTYTEPLPMNDSIKLYFQQLVDMNSDLPDTCRNDICYPYGTRDKYRGDIKWPWTLLGHRRFMACPHADGENITYASCDCVLNEGNATWWAYNNRGCPKDRLHTFLTMGAAQLYHSTGNSSVQRLYDTILPGLADKVTELHDKRVLTEDFLAMNAFLQGFLQNHIEQGERLNTSLLTCVLIVADHLMGPATKLAALQLSQRREAPFLNLWHLLAVAARYTTLTEEMGVWSKALTNICLHIWTTTRTNTQQNFSCPFSAMETVTTTPEIDNGLAQTAVLMINPESNGGDYLIYETTRQGNPSIQGTQPSNDSSVQDTHLKLFSWEDGTVSPDTSEQDTPNNGPYRWPRSTEREKLKNLFTSNLLFVSMQHVTQVTGDVTEVLSAQVDVRMMHSKVLQDPETLCVEDSRNAVGVDLLEITSEEKMHWSENGCHLVSENLDTLPNRYQIHCRCNVTGFLGAFSQGKAIKMKPRKSDPNKAARAGLSFFLGFPYMEELFAAGHVMRAMSLVCLVLTITSYAYFKNTRRGMPTWILLHLCVSLIALLVALYVSEAIIGSKNGCRVASAMRLYLILVSLMWNGVEAVNMYLMLVRVFNSHIQHFLLKATALAWGLPAVWVLLIPAVYIKAFDGDYKKCQFRCVLPRNTLYYGFLLPMCVIIFNNVVIFTLVIRVLKDHAARSQDDCRQSRVVQLCGAVTMLVLLGVPWIFSAFGAIDTRGNHDLALLEGIFQVIFVVFVDLQGIFIFIFHCARIQEVRRHWMAVISSNSIHPGDDLSKPTNKTTSTQFMKILVQSKS